jgi:hypothetical protein
MSKFASLAAAVLVSAAALDAQGAIVIVGGTTSSVSSAAQPNGVRQTDYANVTGLPFTKQITATDGTDDGVSRYASSTSSFDFNQQRFITSASARRINSGYTLTQTDVSFTPDTDTPYSIVGSSTAFAGTGYHSLSVRLLEGTVTRFESTRTYTGITSEPGTTTDQTFTVGQGGTVTGSQAGTLLAGTTYRFFVSNIGRSTTADAFSSGDAATITLLVPEPATATVLAGCSALLLGRRRQT